MFFVIQIVLALLGLLLILCKRLRIGNQEIGTPMATVIGAILVAPLPLSLWLTITTKIPSNFQTAFQTTHDLVTGRVLEAPPPPDDPLWWFEPVVTCGCVLAAGLLAFIALRNNDPLAGVDSKFTSVPLNAPSYGPTPARAVPPPPVAPSQTAADLASRLFDQKSAPPDAIAPSPRAELPPRETPPRQEAPPPPEPPMAKPAEPPTAKYPSMPAALPAMAQQMQQQSRNYFHPACGGYTEVGGDDYRALENPFHEVSETFCCGCGKMVPLASVDWADTGENILKCRKRVADATPFWEQMKRTVFG